MKRSLAVAALLWVVVNSPAVRAQSEQPANAEARAIFQQLVEINTTGSVGSVTKASEAMAKRLLAAGFAQKDVLVAGPKERKKNLVVHYHGSGKKCRSFLSGISMLWRRGART